MYLCMSFKRKELLKNNRKKKPIKNLVISKIILTFAMLKLKLKRLIWKV